jgi:Zn-dependent protease
MLGNHWWATDLYNMGGITTLAAWVIWGVLSVILHELAHGWVAVRLGDTTPIHSGHMTWNPVVHMGTRGLVMFAIVGLPSGFMPIDPSRMRGRHSEARVAIAGPLTNLLLAVISILAGGVVVALNANAGRWLTFQPVSVLDKLQLFFYLGACINIALALFNLMPCPPLDGSRILSDFFRPFREFINTQGGQALSFAAFIAWFFLAGPVVWGVGGAVAGVGTLMLGVALRGLGVGP